MLTREIYRAFSEDGRHGLAVGISRGGVQVVAVDEIQEGRTDPIPAPFLAQKAVFTWQAFRNRPRCYSGDDGSGSIRHRIVAGAISLLAHYGGEIEWLARAEDMTIPQGVRRLGRRP